MCQIRRIAATQHESLGRGKGGSTDRGVAMALRDVGHIDGTPTPRMVFTIGPQFRVSAGRIYIRLEDTMLITEDGAEKNSDSWPIDMESTGALAALDRDRRSAQAERPSRPYEARAAPHWNLGFPKRYAPALSLTPSRPEPVRPGERDRVVVQVHYQHPQERQAAWQVALERGLSGQPSLKRPCSRSSSRRHGEACAVRESPTRTGPRLNGSRTRLGPTRGLGSHAGT